MQGDVNKSIEIDKNFSHIAHIAANIGLEVVNLERILSGQINAVYRLNGQFIVRLSDGSQDGRSFVKEAQILSSISGRVRVPEVIFVDLSRVSVPYDVIVSKAIPGMTLAKMWTLLSSLQQENQIRSLCNEMKQFHQLPVEDFSFLKQTDPWETRFVRYIEGCLAQAETDDEIDNEIVSFLKIYFAEHKKILSYIKDNHKFIHGDLHFENVLVNGHGTQALLDFEYADIAPVDYELTKIVNFCLHPEQFVESQLRPYYKDISLPHVLHWMKRFYPDLFNVDQFVQRQRMFLIPDILWGFKSARLPKISHITRSQITESLPPNWLDKKISMVYNMYEGHILEDMLS